MKKTEHDFWFTSSVMYSGKGLSIWPSWRKSRIMEDIFGFFVKAFIEERISLDSWSSGD